MTTSRPPRRRLAKLAVAACSLLILLGILEIALRMYIQYDPSYYVAFSERVPGAQIDYPFGEIHFNAAGFPDNEFDDIKSRARIAYIGDSVCYGIGAGYGHRISELLEQQFPDLEHMNFSFGVGDGMTEENSDRVIELADRWDFDIILYLLNLNDTLPDLPGEVSERKKIFGLRRRFDWLRGRSYLYTFLRTELKEELVRRGYNITEQPSYELFPLRYSSVFEATANRISKLADRISQRGIRFVVVVLPYEMQISDEAAAKYRKLGIMWNDEALASWRPQELYEELIEGALVIDAHKAFSTPGKSPDDRRHFGVGECFVYNRGDKLDWNHPNRKGHRLIAEYLATHEGFINLLTLP